ncbi:hypothetical protein [Ectobacillus panaciterrae]|uniref:hypothetical protein n=1 Tax=Ectobacillus panaciterrae TaxID=363872 RepID=UPI000420AAFA
MGIVTVKNYCMKGHRSLEWAMFCLMALLNISVDISPKEKGQFFGPFAYLVQLKP